MNKEEYLAKKAQRQKELELEYSKNRVKCLKCMRSTKACLCSNIKPFTTKFRFCFLMHPKEAKKQRVGTGRFSHLCLKNSEIVVGENFDQNKRVQELIQEYSCFLLYPGQDSHNLSDKHSSLELSKEKEPLIFILDGTWPCAKSMMRDSKILHSLARLSFDFKGESLFSIKHQPASYCLSTIESIYQTLSCLENKGLEGTDGKKEHLLEVLQLIIDYQLECANDPDRQSYRSHQNIYKKPSERRRSIKWKSRKICYEDENFN